MRKFFKTFFVILFIGFIILAILFHKRIILTYRIADKYISLRNNKWTTQGFNIEKSSNSMNYKDVIYKNTNGVPLALDIYEPKNKVYKYSPVLLYVHGGSWVYGDKSIPDALSPILDTLREQGYTIISTSYELMRNKENFSKQISDIKDTIRWINKNSTSYNLDTNEVGIIGVSSGAHLSLMASYSKDNEFTDDMDLSNYKAKVKYLIDFAGPTDLSLLNTTSLNYDLSMIFSSLTNKDDIIKKYNPINYVNKTNPNTLIIQSNSDTVVPYKSSEKLYNKCLEVNSSAQLITLKSTAHDLSSISNEDVISLSEGLLKFVIFNSPL